MNLRASSGPRREAGVVLIITLALIVMITFVIVAYFSRATTTRRIESAGSGAARANTLARAASQMILSDIRSEIVAGSQVSQPTGQMAIYKPADPQTVVPARVLATGAMASNATFNSLVKQSTGRFFPSAGYPAANPLITAASGIKTTVTSANNKAVSINRWNAPALNTGAGFGTAGELPEWILVDRAGIAPSQGWDPAFRDYTLSNDRAVIGRFAFNVYDVGGLLDANVAGYPVFTTALTAGEMQSLKGTQAGAHLYESSTGGPIVPGFDQTMQAAFVNTWKFGSTATSKANFLADFMTRAVPPSTTVSPTFADSGFMRPTVRNPGSTSSASNTMAFSRQDLLRLPLAAGGYMAAAALPFLTHFSRELNAPSWYPAQNASAMGGGGAAYAYAANQDIPAASNRNVPNVRTKGVFTRADGSNTVIGEPLIKSRFPLRRIDGIAVAGVSTSAFPVLINGSLQSPTAATLQRDFGLSWDGTARRWQYVGPTGTTVLDAVATLDQVATANREPNFFEILKAFILSGSIGFGTDDSGAGRTFVAAEPRFHQQPFASDAQIIQIGANIIDQWDADKNPTFVAFGADEFAGVENLPYLSKLGFQPQWNTASPSRFNAWLVPSFWTPAQNGTAVGSPSATNPAIRFVMTSGTASAVLQVGPTLFASNTVTGAATAPSVNLTPTANFGGTATPDGASASTTAKVGMTGTPNGKLGIPFTFASTGTATAATTTRAYPIVTNATFEMQAQVGTVWKTYQRWFGCNVNTTSVTAACEPPSGFNWSQQTIFDPEFVALDPRSMRFGVWETHASATDAADLIRGLNDTLDRGAGSGGGTGFHPITGMGPQGARFSGAGGEMANNNANTGPRYTDLDSVQRRGDIAPGSTSAMVPLNSADRSPILSRQIRTVAELGTVFRDEPWRTLSFSTADSPDSALLDAFSVFEPNSVFRSDVTAGKLSLNTRHALVVAAVLADIAENAQSNTPLITSGERDTIASALVAMTTAQPMISKSELVTRFAADPAVTSLGNKQAREAVIRALADVGQTRTWNLMVDVVAQTGRMKQTASSAANFIAQGEKRYWLHVAIDRFTGEVIDQQLEAVYE